jgi:hypothetical protein
MKNRRWRIVDPNQRFGKLILLERVGSDKWASPLWRCRCDCGNEIVRSQAYFFRKINPLRHCGCSQQYKRKKDLTGQRFGKLVVLRLDRTNSHNRHFWVCKCDCGNEKIVAGGHLYTGHSKSCGCYGIESRFYGVIPGQAGYNRLKRNYMNGARSRNLKFDLSDEEFRNLVTGNCYYCGVTPSKKINIDSERSTFLYNGIDRIDHKRGYEKDNVLSCCETCNRMKNILGKDKFIQQCASICAHQMKKA